MPAPLTRIPAKGRRAIILRKAMNADVTMTEVVRSVGLSSVGHPDPSIDRLKTRGAMTDLQKRGLLTRTPRGWRTTGAGLDLLRASEGHHA